MNIPQLQEYNNSKYTKNKSSNDIESFMNPFLKVFEFDPKPPAVGDQVAVKFEEGYYTG